jgi:alkanesulfonate monooxygenase SsuD/methylene tetrahydromethanopterin reductase-like flavin-dependent oxidoreductase (luciferase family)
MRLGFFLSSNFPPGADVDQEMRGLLRQVELAEEVGLDSVFLGHHYLTRSAFVQPLPLASFLAARTERLRLGLGVYLLPLHQPVAVAEELASLDVLSGGRLIAGFGTGYRRTEYRAMGIDYDARYRRLEESVDLLQRLWCGETVEHAGPGGELSGAQLHLRPTQPGGPPIWLGAFGPIGIRRVARLGVSWLAAPEGGLDDLEERLELLRSALDEAGHDPSERDYPVMREAFVAPTREQAVELAGPHLAAQYENYRGWEHGLDLEALLEGHALIGSPEDVVARLLEYRKLGVTDVIVRMQWMGMDPEVVLRSLRLLGSEVAPAIA